MIVWLNGAFGTGKTTTAYELHRRLEHSCVYDPENVGYFLRKNMPEECLTPDFQDMVLWRSFNYQLLKELHETFGGTVIVPMTLAHPVYYDEIIQRLLDAGLPVAHIILYASREAILRRLKKRSLGRLGREAFAVNAIDRCLEYFDGQETALKIVTDNMRIGQVVEEIGEACGLSLLPDGRNGVVAGMERLTIWLRHIR